jgi:hypothetical protein
MRRNYDIFEKFPDGSTLWRACVAGRYEAQRKMQAMAEFSDNSFYAIDIQANEHLPSEFPGMTLRRATRYTRLNVGAA